MYFEGYIDNFIYSRKSGQERSSLLTSSTLSVVELASKHRIVELASKHRIVESKNRRVIISGILKHVTDCRK